jgi:hypothetical protein
MARFTFSMSQGDGAEFYNTTPFQFDRSAHAISDLFVVTTTVTSPAGNWAEGANPIVPVPDTPQASPLTDQQSE